MNDDVLSRMAKCRFGEKEPAVSAMDNPHDWFHETLDNHPECFFAREGDNERVARFPKMGRVIVVRMTREDDKVSWKVHCDLCANESTYIPLKIFLMTENAVKTHRGFLEPHLGEPVTFGASRVIEEGFDLNSFITRAVDSFVDAFEDIEQIASGRDVEEVFKECRDRNIKRELKHQWSQYRQLMD